MIKSLLVLTMAFGVAACAGKQKNEAPPAPTAAEQAATDLQNERTDYVATTEARVAELTKASGDLRAKSQASPKVQAKKLSNAAEDLDSMLVDVRKSLDEVKAAAPENWIDYKRDVEKAMSRAETQYNSSITLL